jgi:Spy/CpxP family protein refolding chaperone
MKTVKTLGAALVVFLFLGGYVYAQAQSNTQTQPTVPEQPDAQKPLTIDEMVQRMKTNLDLTQEQADAIKPILEQNMAKRKALRETLRQQGVDADTIRSQKDLLMQEQDQQLSKILTQSQIDKLDAMRAQRRLHDGEKQGGTSR